MPNYNPQEVNMLQALMGGLNAGPMDPNFAWSVIQSVMQSQAQRQAANQQRMGALTDFLVQNAQAGIPYKGATALADAYTRQPGVTPRMQEVLSALYPERQVRTPGVLPNEANALLQAAETYGGAFERFLPEILGGGTGVNPNVAGQIAQNIQSFLPLKGGTGMKPPTNQPGIWGAPEGIAQQVANFIPGLQGTGQSDIWGRAMGDVVQGVNQIPDRGSGVSEMLASGIRGLPVAEYKSKPSKYSPSFVPPAPSVTEQIAVKKFEQEQNLLQTQIEMAPRWAAAFTQKAMDLIENGSDVKPGVVFTPASAFEEMLLSPPFQALAPEVQAVVSQQVMQQLGLSGAAGGGAQQQAATAAAAASPSRVAPTQATLPEPPPQGFVQDMVQNPNLGTFAGMPFGPTTSALFTAMGRGVGKLGDLIF